MCGIAGLWLINSSPEHEIRESLDKMVQSIAHRGPDDSGVWVNEKIGLGLGHRRLSILDLSEAGHQPMVSKSGRYLIVFNGEIYNHLELRSKLESEERLSSKWHGLSDTETLIEAIASWGLKKTLDLVSGMFAFALWDKEKQKLFLTRDHFGEKPLYWGLLPGYGIVFSSDLVALKGIKQFQKKISHQAVEAYKHLGCIPAPLSIYKDVHQLPPGNFIEISAGPSGFVMCNLPKPITWWSSKDVAYDSSCLSEKAAFKTDLDALNSLEKVLAKAIQSQSIADVPLGSFLSGGIDSSLITALLQQSRVDPVKSFTVSFPDEELFNEAPYAKAIAKHLKTDHTEIPITSNDAQILIPSLARIYTEPFADSSQVPTQLLCREARRSGLTVTLTGDGGDELFGGYNRHLYAPTLHQIFGSWPSPVRRLLAAIIYKAPNQILGIESDGLAQQKKQKLANAIKAAHSIEELHNRLRGVTPMAETSNIHRYALPNAPSVSEQLMLEDILTYLPTDILVKVDRASMSVGLETRAPFLDHRVAKLAWSMPLKYKIRRESRNQISKWALRKLLTKFVPNNLFERPKAGFAMPIGNWLRGPLKDWANDLLTARSLQSYGWFNSNEVNILWKQHLSGDFDHMPKLWSVLMAQAWFAEWQ